MLSRRGARTVLLKYSIQNQQREERVPLHSTGMSEVSVTFCKIAQVTAPALRCIEEVWSLPGNHCVLILSMMLQQEACQLQVQASCDIAKQDDSALNHLNFLHRSCITTQTTDQCQPG